MSSWTAGLLLLAPILVLGDGALVWVVLCARGIVQEQYSPEDSRSRLASVVCPFIHRSTRPAPNRVQGSDDMRRMTIAMFPATNGFPAFSMERRGIDPQADAADCS